MPDLHLIGVHEDGKHALLADRAGAQFRLPIDDALRSVLRREYVDHSSPAEPLRPTEVQAMIRAGASAAEAAERAGWPVQKVHRYESPILAERAHIAQLAGRAHVPAAGALHPVALRDRVEERLEQRGVTIDDVDWDSWRSEDGQWTVEVTFSAGGRRRTASWHFSRSNMTVAPIEDESRWLSGEDHSGQAHPEQGSRRETTRTSQAPAARASAGGEHGPAAGGVGRSGYDAARTVGSDSFGSSPGLQHSEPLGDGQASSEVHRPSPHDPDSDLTAGLRERAATRGRRRPRRLPASPEATLDPSATDRSGSDRAQTPRPAARRGQPHLTASSPSAPVADSPTSSVPPTYGDVAIGGTASPTGIPDTGLASDPDAVPLAPFTYDPETDGSPPGAHCDPQPDGVDGRPETAARPGNPRSAAVAPASSSTAADPATTSVAGRSAARSESTNPPTTAPGASLESVSRSVASDDVQEPELPLDHHETSSAAPDAAPAEEVGPAATAARKTSPARRNRASVPAWDDIMFGTKPPSS
ncbi:MAG: septation protein SepH [Micrococcales bacterium]|nr:septation protein SepH [Micrococcales bacterium]